MGEYNHCGIHTLKLYPIELQTNKVIHQQNIGYEVVGQNKDGKDRKASKVEHHDTHPSKLIQYLKPQLKAVVFHNFIFRWQDVQFKDFLINVLENKIIFYVDFLGNYTLMVQNEIQNMHWYNFQISILVHITHKTNPNCNPTNSKSTLLKEMHYCFDDPSHDTLFVQHAFLFHQNSLQSRSFKPSRNIVWLDGCFGQFKFARAWYFASH